MLPVDRTARHGPGLRLPFGSMRCASRGLKSRAQRKDLPSFVSKINLEKFSASIWGSVDFIHDARLLSPLNPESGKADSSRSRSCAAAVGPGRHSASPSGPPGRVPTAPAALFLASPCPSTTSVPRGVAGQDAGRRIKATRRKL